MFHISIPTKSICPNHQAPFDFVAAAFFELFDLIVALANRSGGKTMDMAILAILDVLANDDCETANFGAIKTQAFRCYSYIKSFLEKQKDFIEEVKGDITIGKTEFKNNSLVQVLVATMAGVNSPHPQKVKADEVDLIPWVILQEALSMPQSKNGVDAVTILGSTRKFAQGPMQRLIDDGEAEVFSWCTWEVMEPWPTDLEMQDKIKAAILKKFGDLDVLPQDLTRFTGYYKWKDFIGKIRSLDVETLRTQWFCEKPDSSGLVYPHFDEVLNMDTSFVLDKTGQFRSIQIWEDFGYAKDHPNCLSFVQVDYMHESFTQFAELKLVEMQTQDIIIEAVLKLMELDLVAEDVKEDISTPEKRYEVKKKLKQLQNYAPYFSIVRLWIPDYHGLTEIADRQGMGCPIPNPPKITHDSVHPGCKNDHCRLRDVNKLYEKDNGIPHVRNFIDERRGKMTTDCPESRSMFMSYSRKRNADGTWSDILEKKDDHFPDTWHYGTVYNWYNIAYQPTALNEAMPEIDEKIDVLEQHRKRRDEIEEHDEELEDGETIDGSLTGGLWDMRL